MRRRQALLVSLLLAASIVPLAEADGAEDDDERDRDRRDDETRTDRDSNQLQAAPRGERPDDVERPGRYILGVDDADAFAVGDRIDGGRVIENLGDGKHLVVSVRDPDEFREKWKADERLRYVHEDTATFQATFTPSEAYYDCCQWGIRDVGIEAAWDSTLGSTDITIAVLDTGVRASHQDIGNILPGWDFVGDDNDPDDCDGHGTHVASTAAGLTDNGIGISGVAQATILPVRVLSCTGSGSYSDIIAGINYAVAQGADVISMSFSGPSSASSLQSALSSAWDAGALLVAAAGNDYGGPISYPARYDDVIAVTAYDESRTLASFSNAGPQAEIAAPGVRIAGAYARSDSDYVYLSGTSMATPIVSGVAALAWSLDPSLTNADVRLRLQQTAVDLGAPGRDTSFGFGALDAAAMMEAPGDAPPTAAFTFSCTHLACDFDASGSSDDDGITTYAWDFGDGQAGTGATPAHAYGVPGSYLVTLTVTDTASQTDDAQDTVEATAPPGPNDPPQAAFTFSCTYMTCSFDASTSWDPDGTIASYAWDFGDGGSASGVAPQHTYDSPGEHMVTLTVTDDDGATDEAIQTVTPTQPPQPAGPALHTHDLDIFLKRDHAKTRVTIFDDDERRQSGVSVTLEMCDQDAVCKVFELNTNRQGKAVATWRNAGPGTYTSCVLDIQKSGFEWDVAAGHAGNGNCATATLGGGSGGDGGEENEAPDSG